MKEVVTLVKKLFFGTNSENWVGMECLLCSLLPEEQGLCGSGHRVGYCLLCRVLPCELVIDIQRKLRSCREEVFIWTDLGGFTNIRFHKWLAETRRRTWNSGVWQCNEELKLANVR
jgi:hypothetical protein